MKIIETFYILMSMLATKDLPLLPFFFSFFFPPFFFEPNASTQCLVSAKFDEGQV